VTTYTLFIFWEPIFGSPPVMHWLHGYAISFAVAITTLLISGVVSPRAESKLAAVQESAAPVDMTPWSLAVPASVTIIILTIIMYTGLYLLAQ